MDVSEAGHSQQKVFVYSDKLAIVERKFKNDSDSDDSKLKSESSLKEYTIHPNLYSRFQHHDSYRQDRCFKFFCKEIAKWICSHHESFPEKELENIP